MKDRGSEPLSPGDEATESVGSRVDYAALCETENGWKRLIDNCEVGPDDSEDPLSRDLCQWIQRLLEVIDPLMHFSSLGQIWC